MLISNKKILMISLLLIFFFSVGCISASENINSNLTQIDYQDSSEEIVVDENILSDTENEDVLSVDEIIYSNNEIFVNPDFEEGTLWGDDGDVYGWNVTAKEQGILPFGYIEEDDDGNRVLAMETTQGATGYGYTIAQYIDFDLVDSITFKYINPNMKQSTINLIETQGEDFKKSYQATFIISAGNVSKTYVTPIMLGWDEVTIDTVNVSGRGLFKIWIPTGTGNKGTQFKLVYFDDFTVSLNDKVKSNFNHNINFNDENIIVQFTNNAMGSITKILWDFGDGNTSEDINPSHIYKPGLYDVTLTVWHGENSANYTQKLNLNYPTIDGKMYATVQEAINDAESGAVIDISGDLSENLIINQNVTLNFNDNKLSTGSINVVNGALVTINDVAFDGENTLSTDESSTLNVYSAQATDANVILSNGNIILDDSSFENSYLTIANANAEINYCNVNASGIIVNGGKSKITNSEFTNCDVAVNQNDGELNLTSNLFTTNKVAVNVTNGTGNINFNAIYGNTEFGLVYKGNINIDNNWFGKDDEIIYLNGNETPAEYADVYQAEETSSDVVFLVLTISSPEIMGANKEYDIVFDLTMNSKGQNTTNMGSLKSLSLEVTSSNGDVETLYLADGIGVTTIHVGDSASEGIDYTILGKTYTTESVVVTTNPEINITATVAETSANVVVTIPYATGNVSLIIDKDKYEKVLDGENTVSQTIDNLIAGTHNIVVIYHGDNVFDYTIQTDSFDVVKSTADLINELDEQNSTIETQAKEISNLTDTVKTQNSTIESQAKEISNLTDTVKTQNSTIDSQKALINNLNETINDQTTNKTSNPIATSISVKDITTTATTAKYFTISLIDANNKTLVNKTIKYTVNGKTDSVTTNGSGIATVKVSYSTAGTRYYTFSFLGDEKYSASIATAKVVVNKKATKITAPKKTFKVKTKTKKVQVKLASGKTVLKNKKVTLKVKGKTYTAKTNKKGIATFKITKLTKKGNFKYTVKFSGDKAYKAINKNGKIIVK